MAAVPTACVGGEPQTVTAEPRFDLDSIGAVHLLWSVPRESEWQRDIYYSHQTPGGSWADPEAVAYGYCPCDLAVDPDDHVHLIYTVTGDLVYRGRGDTGWGSLETLPTYTWGGGQKPRMVAGLDGTLYVAFIGDGYFSGPLAYLERAPEGGWQNPVAVWDQPYAYLCDIAVSPDNQVHVAWQASEMPWWGPADYRTRFPDGEWSPPMRLVPDQPWIAEPPGLWPQTDGRLDVAWRFGDWQAGDIVYAPMSVPRYPAASLTQTVQVPPAPHGPTLSFMAHVETPDTSLQAAVNGTQVFSQTYATGDWAQGWADLSPWAGQVISVEFKATGDLAGAVPSIKLDDVSLGSWLTPAVLRVTPDHLLTPPAAPTLVTITGENFIPPNAASIGGIDLQNLTWINENTLQASLPPGLGLGRHPVWVVNAGGQRGVLPGGFTVGRELFLPIAMK